MTVPGGSLPCGGVTRVSVRSTHRRRGLLTAMMRRQLDEMHERGEPLAALYASEAATRLALDAIQLLGANGYINDYPAGRLLRDAKAYEIGAGTSEIRRWLIGRELFGEGA